MVMDQGLKLLLQVILAAVFLFSAYHTRKQQNRKLFMNWLTLRLFGEALHEVGLLLSLLSFYDLCRGMVMASEDVAKQSALRIMSFESQTQLDIEIPLQQYLLTNSMNAVIFLNFYYLLMHWIGVTFFFLGMFVRRIWRGDKQSKLDYRLYRSSYLVMNYIGLMSFYAFPTAPPRLLPEFGYAETLSLVNKIQPYKSKAFVNPYAAMPSLHFGWALLFGHTFAQLASFPQPVRWLRWLGYLHPILMFISILSTGNHFVLDAVAGGLDCVVSIMIVKNAMKVNWHAVVRLLTKPLGCTPTWLDSGTSADTENETLVSSSESGDTYGDLEMGPNSTPITPTSAARKFTNGWSENLHHVQHTHATQQGEESGGERQTPAPPRGLGVSV